MPDAPPAPAFGRGREPRKVKHNTLPIRQRACIAKNNKDKQ